MADIDVGQVLLGRYHIERRLGLGSNGTVWLARDHATQERVAIKSLHTHLLDASAHLARFTREAEVLIKLRHPGIAGARGLARGDDGQLWIVLELAQGQTLDQVIGAHTVSGRRFEDREVLRIFSQLVDATAHAHQQGVVHRDIKPLNVMIDEAADLEVKLLDFGLAKLVDGEAREATTRGRRLGSMFYMAPEQVRGDPIDARADQFALASILFELLTLRRAWAVDDAGRPASAFDKPVRATQRNAPVEVFARIVAGPRPRVSSYRPGVGPALDAVVSRAWAVEKAERYPDALAFGRAVAEVLRSVPAETSSETLVMDGDVVDEGSNTALISDTRLALARGEARPVDDRTPVSAPSVPTPVPITPRAATVPSSELRPWRAVALVSALLAAAASLLVVYVVGTGESPAASTAGAERSSAAMEAASPRARALPEVVAVPDVASSTPAAAAAPSLAAASSTPAPSPRAAAAMPARPSPARPSPTAASASRSGGRGGRAAPTASPSPAPSRAAAAYPRLWALLAEAKADGDPSSISRLSAAIIGAAAADVDDEIARGKIQRLADSSSLVGDLQGLEAALSMLSATAPR